MNRYKVEARSLEAAMQKVKEEFGPDALVLDVREYRRKEPDGLGVSTVFELTVAPQSDTRAGAKVERQGEEVKFTNDSLEKLRTSVEKIERMIQRINAASDKMATSLADSSSYPIKRMLLSAGASKRTVDIIASSFEENVPPANRSSIDSAANHLTTYIHAVKTNRWEDISGVHFFFGSGGSGKTSVVIKLAGRLVKAGKNITIVGFLPRHGGDIKRLEIAGDALGVEVIVAFALDELRKCLELKGDRILLVDTPCCFSEKTITSEHFRRYLISQDTSHKHLVFDLNADIRRLERELEVFRYLGCDYAVLTKLDISFKSASFLDLAVRYPVIFSFVNFTQDYSKGFELASTSLLLRIISPELSISGEKELKKSLNTETQTAEKKKGGEVSEAKEAVLEYA